MLFPTETSGIARPRGDISDSFLVFDIWADLLVRASNQVPFGYGTDLFIGHFSSFRASVLHGKVSTHLKLKWSINVRSTFHNSDCKGFHPLKQSEASSKGRKMGGATCAVDRPFWFSNFDVILVQICHN
jgi:hypothetical protein